MFSRHYPEDMLNCQLAYLNACAVPMNHLNPSCQGEGIAPPAPWLTRRYTFGTWPAPSNKGTIVHRISVVNVLGISYNKWIMMDKRANMLSCNPRSKRSSGWRRLQLVCAWLCAAQLWPPSAPGPLHTRNVQKWTQASSPDAHKVQ